MHTCNLDPAAKTCNFTLHELESITSIQLLNLPLHADMAYFVTQLTNMDYMRPVFDVRVCTLWMGWHKQKGRHISPRSPFHSLKCSITRRIFEAVFCMEIDTKSKLLRHYCPLLTGEFNSGLCCNPLHLRLGCAQENTDDILVHNLVKDLVNNTPIDYFCFQHNEGMLSTCVQSLTDRDTQLIQQLIHTKQLRNPFLNCVCNVIHLDYTYPHNLFLLLPNALEDSERRPDELGDAKHRPNKQRSCLPKKRKQCECVITVEDRPAFDVDVALQMIYKGSKVTRITESCVGCMASK